MRFALLKGFDLVKSAICQLCLMTLVARSLSRPCTRMASSSGICHRPETSLPLISSAQLQRWSELLGRCSGLDNWLSVVQVTLAEDTTFPADYGLQAVTGSELEVLEA